MIPARDSKVWWIGIVASVIVAVAANQNTLFPWFPDHVKHTLSLVSFVIGTVSGIMASSPAKSKQEKRQDEFRRERSGKRL